jgi:cinnamoyl-CoA reductase
LTPQNFSPRNFIDLTMSNTDKSVLVTGGTGFLGGWCVSLLLDRGYTVHATCRSLDKAQYLLTLPGANERLKLFANVDLLVDGAFEEAMTGCESVLHTASPFYMSDDEEALMKPAVDGTKNVLNTCAKLGVKKVGARRQCSVVECRAVQCRMSQ